MVKSKTLKLISNAKLQKLLTKKVRTRVWLARELGISHSTLTNYIYGKSNPPLVTAVLMARILNCNLEDFMYQDIPLQQLVDSVARDTGNTPTQNKVVNKLEQKIFHEDADVLMFDLDMEWTVDDDEITDPQMFKIKERWRKANDKAKKEKRKNDNK